MVVVWCGVVWCGVVWCGGGGVVVVVLTCDLTTMSLQKR